MKDQGMGGGEVSFLIFHKNLVSYFKFVFSFILLTVDQIHAYHSPHIFVLFFSPLGETTSPIFPPLLSYHLSGLSIYLSTYLSIDIKLILQGTYELSTLSSLRTSLILPDTTEMPLIIIKCLADNLKAQ